MNRTRPTVLALGAVVVLALGWLLLQLLDSRGVHLPPVPWAVTAALGVIAAGVLTGGLVVRAYLRGKHPRLRGVHAARLVVLGKAAAWAGALLAGWYGAQALAVLALWEIAAQRDRFAPALVACGAAVVVAVVGLVTERFGQLPPPSDDLSPEDAIGHHGAHD